MGSNSAGEASRFKEFTLSDGRKVRIASGNVKLGDGEVLGTGPIYGGGHLHLGPMAVLRRDDVRVVELARERRLRGHGTGRFPDTRTARDDRAAR